MKPRQAFLILNAVVVCALQGTTFGADVGDYLGRWNIKVKNTGDTFSTAWLKVENNDDHLKAAIVWRAGGVNDVKDVTIDESGIHFNRGKQSFTAKLEDGQLHGVVTTDNDIQMEFIGWPAQEMSDATGRWEVVASSRPDAKPGQFEIREENGRIVGTATDPQGHVFTMEDVRFDGRILSFKARSAAIAVPARDVEVEIRGDRLVGHVVVPATDRNEKMTVPVSGRRMRTWGEPITLLHQDRLDGWAARDPNKRFGWTVKDGILENRPPDVDIVSDSKFRDFQLHLEYKVDSGANSGVYLRGRYELQILGETRVQDHGNMAVYSRLKPKKNPLRLGEWNELDVTFVGRWLTVSLNGETVHDNRYLDGPTGGAWDPREEEPGPLLLQGDHGKVSFRNIVVRPSIQH